MVGGKDFQYFYLIINFRKKGSKNDFSRSATAIG